MLQPDRQVKGDKDAIKQHLNNNVKKNNKLGGWNHNESESADTFTKLVFKSNISTQLALASACSYSKVIRQRCHLDLTKQYCAKT